MKKFNTQLYYLALKNLSFRPFFEMENGFSLVYLSGERLVLILEPDSDFRDPILMLAMNFLDLTLSFLA